MADMPTKVAALVGTVAAGGLDSMVYLDPGKEDEREAIDYFLERAGKGRDRYPALHATKDGGGTEVPAGAPLDACTLVEMGRAEDGTAAAQGWLGSAGGAYLSGVHTMMVDDGSGEVLASGSATQVGAGLVRARTGEDAAPATAKMTALSFFHAQRSPGEPLRFGLAAAPVEQLGDPPTIAIQAPTKIRSKKPGTVVIGIARQRGWQNTDCDYIYPETSNAEPDRLVVPFVGSAEFSEGVTLKGMSIATFLWCNHMPLSSLETQQQLAAGFKQASRTKITWSFPFDDLPIQTTKSLKYQELPEADDNLSAFWFRFQVLGSNGTTQTVSIFSPSWPDKPTTGYTKQIENLEYWWHCIDAQAAVTISDGTTRKMVEIDNQVQVRTPGGGSAQIEATTLDVQDTDSVDVILKLTTTAGRSLILSALHPVLSAGVPVMAADLQPGQAIDVDTGTDQVASCVPEPAFEGWLGNLKLAEGSPRPAFFANGIAVGDFTTLTTYRNQVRRDPDYMLARLPESHHRDYLSGLEDEAA